MSQILLYDISGQLIRGRLCKEGSRFILDLSEKPDGIYFLRIKEGGHSLAISRLIKK